MYSIHSQCISLSMCAFRAIGQLLCLLILTFLSFGNHTWSLPYPANLSNDNSPWTKNNSLEYQFLNNRHCRVCDDGYGIYGAISVHHSLSEDRRWYWQCRKLAQENLSHSCYWSRDVNYYNKDISFTCCENEYIRGVDSYHDNSHDDRRWSFYCCDSTGLTTHTCYTIGYQNSLSLDGDLDFQAPFGRVVTGVFSQYNNHRE